MDLVNMEENDINFVNILNWRLEMRRGRIKLGREWESRRRNEIYFDAVIILR